MNKLIDNLLSVMFLKKSEKLTIVIAPEIKTAVKQLSELTGFPASDIIQEALIEYLEKTKYAIRGANSIRAHTER